jgi:hypothetical protein
MVLVLPVVLPVLVPVLDLLVPSPLSEEVLAILVLVQVLAVLYYRYRYL